jgi:hypothetical protein
MELLSKTKNIQHLAGIVPVAGQPIGYGFPWHDSMIPIAQNYLAVENAIYECAIAGCESIWVVCHSGLEPLLRHRLGDYITDPSSIENMSPIAKRRDISIFYVPVNPNDKNKRDSLGWSVLYGADSAFRIAAFLSKWIIPERYYCAFPYGITDTHFIRSQRMKISGDKKVIFHHKNLTVKDGLHISFTFDANDYKKCRDIVKQRTFDSWRFDEAYKDTNNDKKNYTRFYSIQQVFSALDLENSLMIELPWFYDISSWDNYRAFMSSDESSKICKKERFFINQKRRKFATDLDIREQWNKKDI